MSLVSHGSARSLELATRRGADDLPRAARVDLMRGSSPASPEWTALDAGHPLRLVDRVVHDLLRSSGAVRNGAPVDERQPDRERLVRSLLLQVLYSISCDQRLLEQLRYDLRFRWFTGLGGGDRVWSLDAHAHARDAMFRSGAARQVFEELLRGLRPIAMIWPEYFSSDESLVERWQANARQPAPSAEAAGLRQQELLKAAGLSDGAVPVDSRMVRVLEWILTRISEPDLNCNSLAAGVGMSRRALYYLFDAHALTPTVAIRNIRLEHCKRLLEDARHRKRKITGIALDHGFSNIYSFSRSFKQRYGIGPRDCRIVGLHSACIASV